MMFITTTQNIEGRSVIGYKGIVTSESIIGSELITELSKDVDDVKICKGPLYEDTLRVAKELALNELIERAEDMDANAIIGLSIDYEPIYENLLMVCCTGTAVMIE